MNNTKEIKMTFKQSWKGISGKERTSIIKEKIDVLASKLIVDPEQLRALAKNWAGGFHSYSFGNLFSIWVQNPKASLCAGQKSWNKNHNRVLKDGEFFNALWILAPNMVSYVANVVVKDENGMTIFNEDGSEKIVEEKRTFCKSFLSVPVYDISQTEGDDIDIGMNSSKFIEKKFTVSSIMKLFPEYEWKMVNSISDGSTNGKDIRVASRKNKAQEVTASIHELAHVILGHCRYNGYEAAQKLSRSIQELEAEAVAYVVAECMGIENPDSATYIAQFKGDEDKMKNSTYRVLSAVTKIMKRLTGEEQIENEKQ